MSLLILSDRDVARITEKIDPQTLTTLMALVFVRSSAKSGPSLVDAPLRSSIKTDNYTALFMPARIKDLGTTIKVVSVPRESSRKGIPGSTLVLDEESGAVKAIVNAGSLTALRTAAGSALATKLIGPGQPQVLVAFGAGKQIEAHVKLLLRSFPSLQQCIIINRSWNERLDALKRFLRSHFLGVVSTVACAIDGIGQDGFDLQRAISNADVICTATSSTMPLFPSSWVKAGTHINLVGSYTKEMREIDNDLVKRAGKIFVDSREACVREAGELIGAKLAPSDLIELGEITGIDGKGIQDRILTMKSAGDVSIFKSVGIGLQDTAIATLVVATAISDRVGTSVDYDSGDFFSKSV